MKPSDTEPLSRVLEKFRSVEGDIQKIRECRDSIHRPEYSAKEVTLAHQMELACVDACARSFEDRTQLARLLDEAILTTWANRNAKYYLIGAGRQREKAYANYEWTRLQWLAEHAYSSEMSLSAATFDQVAEAMLSEFERMEAEWKSWEQKFRKPVLELYKSISQIAQNPLPQHISVMAASLNERLTTELVDSLEERRNVFLEQQGIQKLISEYTMSIQKLPSEVFHRTSNAASPPFSRAKFDVRTHAEGVHTHRLYPMLRQLSEDMNRHYESLLRRANEIRDVVEVNLGLAEVAEGEEKETLFRDGLERAAQRIQELSSKYRENLESVTNKARSLIEVEMDLIRRCFAREDFGELEATHVSLQRKEQARDVWNHTVALWSRAVEASVVRYRFAREKVEEVTLPVRRFLGYVDEDAAAPQARSRASDYLNETERRLAQLPLIYRSLFSFEPVKDVRYLKGRVRQLETMDKDHQRWMDGYFTSLAIVGERGSGKTSVLNEFLSTTLKELPVRRINVVRTITTQAELLDILKAGFEVPHAEDFEELMAAIRAYGRQRVVLEGMQNLYLRHMNGFEALERFLLFITESAKDVFWVVTCTRYAWNYLEDAIQVSSTFTDEIITDTLGAAEIRSAIMSRHRVSGYRAVFTPSDSVKRSRAYKKLMDDEEARQEFLEKAYFDDLAKWSRGNITIAMLFWLRTIRDVTNEAFTIQPVTGDLIEIGDAFTLDDLFAITAILQHQDVTIHELALNQNRSEHDCRMTLTRLHARRILNESEGRYSLNSILLRPLTLRLQEKNILH